MSEFNPYEAPDIKGELTRLGSTNEPLFIANSSLVYTGKVGDNIYVKKTLTYAPPWVLILCLFNLLIGAIIYLIVRKQGKIGYYVSAEARAARFKLALINWGIFLAGIGAIALAVVLENNAIAVACPILILVSLIIYIAKLQGLTPGWVDATTIGVKGIKVPIMEQLVAASQL